MTEDIDNKEPGLSLVRARQEKNLTQEEVAARLHLSANQIRLLEDNDYEDLPEATYVKGYIRNYAKLLGIDSVVLIAAYLERVSPKMNDTVELVATSQQSTKVSDESKAMYSIVGIVVLVVAVVAIWIGSQTTTDQSSAQQTEAVTETSEQSGELFGPSSEDQSIGDAEDEADSKKTADQELLEPAYPSATPANNVPAEVSVKQEGVQPKQQQTESIKQAPDTITETTKPESNENKEVNLPQSTQSIDELVLFFEQDSWADVRDTNGKKLLYKTINKGRVVSIKGIAPFNIFLGNADGVKLSYNGKQIDFEEYKRGLIARFTVGR